MENTNRLTTLYLNLYLLCRCITRHELAQELGVPYSTLIRWLNAPVRISPDRAESICNYIKEKLRITDAIVIPGWVDKQTQEAIIVIIALAFRNLKHEGFGAFFPGHTRHVDYLDFLLDAQQDPANLDEPGSK